MLQVTMMGTSGSGKTTYMSALESCLSGVNLHPDHFTIAPTPMDDSTVEHLLAVQGNFHKISWASRQFRFPDPTDSTTLWSFDLLHKPPLQVVGNLVAEFNWIDYRGGILDQAVRNEIADSDVTRVIGSILASQAVLIFADAFLITYYENNVRAARRHTGIDSIYRILNAYNQKHRNKNLIYLIVLTKCDGLEERWRQDNYQPLVEKGMEVFDSLINITASNPNWIGGIMPMSAVGEGNAERTITRPGTFAIPPLVENSIIDEPIPLYVELPLFYTIGKILEQITSRARRSSVELETEIAEMLEHDTTIRRIMSWITGKKTPREIAAELRQKREEDELVVQKYSSYLRPLLMKTMRTVREIR